MKPVRRLAVGAATVAFLAKRSGAVAAAPDAKAEAARLWGYQSNHAFRELRRLLGEMASGLDRCMYCEDSEGTDIEHFWPKATYPQRAFDWLNYLLACTRCNSNFKRDQFPLDAAGAPLLLDPTAEDPLDHLDFTPETGKFRGSTVRGETSITVYGLDRPTLEKGRANAWVGLQAHIAHYAFLRSEGDVEMAGRIERTVREHPFASVLAALVRIAQGPAAEDHLHPRCLGAIRQFPEILTWE